VVPNEVGRRIVNRQVFGRRQTCMVSRCWLGEAGEDYERFSEYPVIQRIFETDFVMTMLECWHCTTFSRDHCKSAIIANSVSEIK
jgi:hypothetical protein